VITAATPKDRTDADIQLAGAEYTLANDWSSSRAARIANPSAPSGRPLAGVDGCQMRLHSTTLYMSLFRYDDEIMANPHAYGEPASANPALHLRRLDGGQIAGHYLACFERVWDTAKPWYGEEV
jgi:hypothetical protein